MARQPGWGGPKRGYSWPPFQVGNEAALKHGARSERKIAPIAEQLIAELLEQRPDLRDPRHQPSVHAWGFAEAACRLYRAYADEHGLVDDHGNDLGFVPRWQRAESQAESRRRELGLGPLGEARLVTVRAEATMASGDLGALIEQGRRALERRRRRQLEISSNGEADTHITADE